MSAARSPSAAACARPRSASSTAGGRQLGPSRRRHQSAKRSRSIWGSPKSSPTDRAESSSGVSALGSSGRCSTNFAAASRPSKPTKTALSASLKTCDPRPRSPKRRKDSKARATDRSRMLSSAAPRAPLRDRSKRSKTRRALAATASPRPGSAAGRLHATTPQRKASALTRPPLPSCALSDAARAFACLLPPSICASCACVIMNVPNWFLCAWMRPSTSPTEKRAKGRNGSGRLTVEPMVVARQVGFRGCPSSAFPASTANCVHGNAAGRCRRCRGRAALRVRRRRRRQARSTLGASLSTSA